MIKKSLLPFLFVILLGNIIPVNSFAQYTLTDNDVVVVNGVIESCSYNFAITDIIIPDVLDGQTVVGIADGSYPVGVFSEKGITSIVLPSTIQIIGEYAFYRNQISTLDLSICPQLSAINISSFEQNNINSLNFTGCSSLTIIGNYSFFNNSISVLNLNDCINLTEIGGGSFVYNNMIELDLTGCVSLHTIGFDAFRSNALTNKLDLSLCQNLASINNCAFMHNQIDTLLYPSSILSLGIGAFADNNLVFVNNLSSEGFIYNRFPDGTEDSTYLNSYGGVLDTIAIPEMVTKIGRRAFDNCAMEDVDFNLCVDLTSIEYNAFTDNQIDSLDLSTCTKLNSIGPAAFYQNNLVYVNLTNCDSLEIIDHESFLSNSLSNIDLTNCLRLSHVGYRAFDGNIMTDFILPTPIIPDSTLDGWRDSYGALYPGGATVNDLLSFYDAEFTEVLTYTVTFTVTDGTNPIINANVNLAGYGDQITDASGVAVFADVVPEDNINYTITASNYDDNIDSLSVVDADVTENVELTLTTYNVTFVVEDNNGSLENATVDLTGYGSQVTDVNGVTVFTDVVPENDIVYTVMAANYYNVTDSLSVVDVDVTDSVLMSLMAYSVTFNVSDGTVPVLGATVDLVGYGLQVTDYMGVAVFDSVVPDTDINYSVFCSGYISYNDSITVVDADIIEDVVLTPAITSYSVTFFVADGSNPIPDASISLTGYGSQLTDNQGIAIFNDVSPGNDIPYNVIADGYNTFSGFVTVVDEDIEENVTLTLSSYNVTFEISDGNNNIADATVTLEGYGSQISDNDGIVIFNEVFPDLLNYTVEASSFFAVSGAVEVENDNVYEYVMMTPTGVNDYNCKQITISPNPSSSYINIANCRNNKVRIFNAEGVLLNCIVPDNDYYKVDITNISSGLIFIQIDNSVFKIIKK